MPFVSSLMFRLSHRLLIRKCKNMQMRIEEQKNQWLPYRSHSVVVKEICHFAEITSGGCELAPSPIPQRRRLPKPSTSHLPLCSLCCSPAHGARKEERKKPRFVPEPVANTLAGPRPSFL